MGKVYDVNPSLLIEMAAEALKKEKLVETPQWAMVVKTGAGQDRLPENPDWWYFRSASILRKIYTKGPIGVSKLRTYYGTKKNRGVKPEKFYKAGGKIIRIVLQQLETAGLVIQIDKGGRKGRIITPKGASFLDKVVKVNDGDRRNKKEDVAREATGNVESTDAGSAKVAETN
ncbi:MAG: 30S ribosomal protein S19e [Nanoarchaeota archaeon]|nr:30S ribosomal protein S19e [Nanoarchaeota archaeon]